MAVMLPPQHTHSSLIYGCVWVHPYVWGLALSSFLPTTPSSSEKSSIFSWKKKWNKRKTQAESFIFCCFFYLSITIRNRRVHLKWAKHHCCGFRCYWCRNNKSSRMRQYSATCCFQKQHCWKINNHISNFVHSSHRKPSDYSTYFPWSPWPLPRALQWYCRVWSNKLAGINGNWWERTYARLSPSLDRTTTRISCLFI